MKRRTLVARCANLASAAALLFLAAGSGLAADKVTVFAAASLKNALDAASASWTADTGTGVTLSYAASSALAKQIQDGAPADVFISADLDWMKTLADAKLIADGSVVKLLGNDIVLVTPADSPIEGSLHESALCVRQLGHRANLCCEK
jgi:molybdate transport system substrate-binding protein